MYKTKHDWRNLDKVHFAPSFIEFGQEMVEKSRFLANLIFILLLYFVLIEFSAMEVSIC